MPRQDLLDDVGYQLHPILQVVDLVLRNFSPRPRKPEGELREHHELGGEGLSRRHPDLWSGLLHDVGPGYPGQRRPYGVRDAEDGGGPHPGMVDGLQRVIGLPRLTHSEDNRVDAD